MLVLPLTRAGAEKEARNADRRPYGEYEYGSRSVVDLERDTCIYCIGSFSNPYFSFVASGRAK